MPYFDSRPREITASTPAEQLINLISNVYGLPKGFIRAIQGICGLNRV